jgi:CDP-paratose 2-epimerase
MNLHVLVTGGAGFIGANVADRHLRLGHDVTILDNLSRPGSASNLHWLREHRQGRLAVVRGDVRDAGAVDAAIPDRVDRVYHLAAQVAVTASVDDPRADFEVNALGTLNVLEAVRRRAPGAVLIYASTNKVYGAMEGLGIRDGGTRYTYAEGFAGVSEHQPLDFHSPYGCSKGSGDAYVRDYARIYGLRTVVMRQSCVYGTRQMGLEDQGWIAHFCISARLGRPITIYGDGKQVRDVLWIDDLVEAYEAAARAMPRSAGEVYNIGGGPEHTVSVWREFAPMLERLAGAPLAVRHAGWRPGDQPVYVSDIGKARRELGWRPRVPLAEGLERLWKWTDANVALFR